MPPKSTVDERIVVPGRPGDYRGRVYVTELAKYLGNGEHALKRFAKKHGLLRKAGRGTGRAGIYYVSEYAALRMIAYFRVRDVEVSEKRKTDPHLERLMNRARGARKRAERALAGPKA